MRTAEEMRKLNEDHEKSIKDEAKVEEVLMFLDEQCSRHAKDGFHYYRFTQLADGSDSFPIELLASKLSKLGYEVSVRISQFDFYIGIKW